VLDLTSAGQMIGLISVGLTLVSTLVRNAVLNKEKLKEQKEKLKHHQAMMKEAQKKKDMKGMQHHQQQMMEVSMEQMRHGMKPMLFTTIPFLIVFGWMSSSYNAIGFLENTTLIDPLPSGMDVVSIQSIPNTTYMLADGAIVWRLGNLTHPWDWSRFGWYPEGHLDVAVKAKGAPEAVAGGPIRAGYVAFHVNGSATRVETGGDPEANIWLNVTRSQPAVSGETVTYRIDYENLNTYYVVTLFGVGLGWLRWYILCSFVSSMVFNKVLGNT
jgi:uncharacterized membrane protein (DUF106 family)